MGEFGSGKSSFILSRLEEDWEKGGIPTLIVPSRIQRDKFSRELSIKLSGYTGRIVYTLNEFLQKFLEEKFTSLSVINDFESYILLRMIIEENKNQLLYFKNIDAYSGVIRLMYSLVTEMRAGLLMGEYKNLQKRIFEAEIENPKWKDIFLIYTQFERRLEEKNLYDNHRLFLEAARLLKNNKLSFSIVAFDGFFDFTATQFEFIKAIIHKIENQGKEVLISLPDIQSPQVMNTLENLEKEFSVTRVYIKERRNRFSSLAKNFGKHEEKDISGIENERIFFLAGFGRYREVVRIANEIKRLILEEDYHFRDLALIVPNPDDYRNLVLSVFNRYKIPHYISRDEPLKGNPAVLYIYLIARGVMQEKAFDTIQIASIVNSSYMQNPDFKVLGDFPAMWGFYFRGNPEDWEEAWKTKIKYLKDEWKEALLDGENELTIEETQVQLEKLNSMHESFRKLFSVVFSLPDKISVDDFAEWISNIVNSFGMQKSLSEIEENYSKDFIAFRKLKEALISLKKVLFILGKEIYDSEEFFLIFDNLIQNISYRYQYYPVDGVAVLTPFDARESHFKVVFVCGLNEGEFPSGISLSLLNREEKIKINNLATRIILQGEEEKNYSDSLDFSLMITRATEKLFLSYTPYDESGREILPSIFFSSIWDIVCKDDIKKLGEEAMEIIPSDIDKIYDLNELISYKYNLLPGGIKNKVIGDYAFLNVIQRMKEYQECIDAINEYYESENNSSSEMSELQRIGLSFSGNLDFENPEPLQEVTISKNIKKEILDRIKKMKFSSTSIEAFGNCRYFFFVRYVLGIREEAYPSREIESRFKGSFLHSVLKEYVEKTKDFSQEELMQNAQRRREILREVMERQYEYFLNKEGERNIFALEKEYYYKVLSRFIDYEAENLRDYNPVETEFGFDTKIEVSKNENFLFRGMIDRIDKISVSGLYKYRVLDYKTGGVSHFKRDFFIPLKLFQGFLYARVINKPIGEIAYVSLEKEGSEKKAIVFPYNKKGRGKNIEMDNFDILWEQKRKELCVIFDMMKKGDFVPFTVKENLPSEVLDFYMGFLEEGGNLQLEAETKCDYCPYIEACLRREKLFSQW